MIAGPHQIDIENSSTIEGILKKFKSTPPQNEVEISITIEERKIFFKKGTQKHMYLSSTIRGALIILINFTVSPSHFGVLMSVTIEGTFKEISKTFADDPLKAHLKYPVIIEGLKLF